MTDPQVRVVGRYALYNAIAAGGMATVHLGRLLGPVGFSRTVAIKRLHAQFASDPEFVSMFLDEARLAARIRHPNVVPTLDVVATGGELFLVMEYVPGESLARLARILRERKQALPLPVLASIMAGMLHGLHAAHEAKDERGYPLGLVHRDVSPQNVLVGTDGVARVLDFGVAKAAGRVQTTREGQIKGKLAYMPPEQLRGADVSRQSDIYAAGVMLWELVTGSRLFFGDNEGVVVAKVLEGRVERPSQVLARARTEGASFPPEEMRSLEALDGIVLRALSMQREDRHATAREMAIEIERSCPLATTSEVGDWVEGVARDVLSSRAALIAEIESSASHIARPESGRLPVPTVGSTLGAPRDDVPTKRSGPPQRPPSIPHAPPSAPPASGVPPAHASAGDALTATQPSSISVVTGSQDQRAVPARGKRRAIVASAVGLLFGAGVLASAIAYRHGQRAPSTPEDFWGVTSESPAAAQPEAPPPPAAAPPTEAPPKTEPKTEPETEAETEPASELIEIDDEAPPAAVSSPTLKRKEPAKRAGTSPKPAPASPPTDDCTTPFWYDEHGVKKYKPHCLNE